MARRGGCGGSLPLLLLPDVRRRRDGRLDGGAAAGQARPRARLCPARARRLPTHRPEPPTQISTSLLRLRTGERWPVRSGQAGRARRRSSGTLRERRVGVRRAAVLGRVAQRELRRGHTCPRRRRQPREALHRWRRSGGWNRRPSMPMVLRALLACDARAIVSLRWWCCGCERERAQRFEPGRISWRGDVDGGDRSRLGHHHRRVW